MTSISETLTGNETITGNLVVQGTTSLSFMTFTSNTLVTANSPTTSVTLNTTTNLTTWTTASDTGSNFTASTGIYTAPSAGLYEITAVINYSFSAAESTQLGTAVPSFQIINSSTSAVLLSGTMLAMNSSISGVFTGKFLLTSGQVVLHDYVVLTSGEQIRPRYFANGVTLTNVITFTGTLTTFTVMRVSN